MKHRQKREIYWTGGMYMNIIIPVIAVAIVAAVVVSCVVAVVAGVIGSKRLDEDDN